MLHGVAPHQVTLLLREWKAGDKRYSRLVFIGRNLDKAALQAGFESCAT